MGLWASWSAMALGHGLLGRFADRWLAPEARAQVRDRIVAIEKTTGAEIVVTVAVSSGSYRQADHLFGALCALGLFLFYQLHPAPLPDDLFGAAVVLSYPLGMLICSLVAPLRRLLLSKRLLRHHARREARARFVEQGITSTRARTGILVFVSRFERAAELVADVGIPVRILEDWQTIVDALDRAARQREPAALLGVLDQLGALLARAVPRAEDDINELPDEVAS
jgi:putative membrane protein